MKQTLITTLSLGLLMAMPAQAEVAEVTDIGFTVKANIHINSDRADAYAQLLKIGDWWFSDHTWFGSSQAMKIEARAGGCWCEISGEKSAIHGVVSHIDPGSLLRMNAQLGPLQELAVSGVLTFKLEDMGNGSHLYATYSVNGFTAEKAKEWAAVVDYVINEQVTRYGRLLNTGKADE